MEHSRRIVRVLTAALLIGAWLLALPVAAGEPITEPVKVGKLSRRAPDVARAFGLKTMHVEASAPNGTAIVSTKLDRLYQIFTFDSHFSVSDRTVIAERDLGSLKLLRLTQVLGRVAMQVNNSSQGTEFGTALDERNDRLFIEFGRQNFVEPTNSGIITVDLKKMKAVAKTFPQALVRASYKGQVVFGMEYDEKEQVLLMVLTAFDENFQTLNVVSVVGFAGSELNSEGPLPASAPGLQGPRILRGCRQNAIASVSSTRAAPIMLADGPDFDSPGREEKTWFVTPCLTTPYSVNTALIRIDRSTLFAPQGAEKTIPAPTGMSNWILDRPRGRMHLLNTSRETDDWVYEVKSNAFIGIIELSPKGVLAPKSTGLGIDNLTGRLFAFGLHNNPQGKQVSSLMITQAGQDPIPQADIYNLDKIEDADAEILVDGKRNRVIVLRRKNSDSGGPSTWHDDYTVYAVPSPLEEQPDEDPDAQTKQVKEEEGKTTAEYGGSATAYGARVLLAAGFTGLQPSNGNESVGQLYKDLNARCGLRDRELVLGGFAQAELASGGTPDALAESVHMDDGTAQDFGKPSRCDLYYQYVGPVFNVDVENIRRPFYFTGLMKMLDERVPRSEEVQKLCLQYLAKDPRCTDGFEGKVDRTASPTTTWEYKPAECSSKGQMDEPGNNAKYLNGETWVDCLKANEVQAHAEGRADGTLGTTLAPVQVKIGRATSSTKVTLDDEKGLVSTATSTVENVVIGPVTIGFIENSATSIAHGRTGSAKTLTYEPKIGLVRGPGITSCQVRCDIDDLIPQLNNAFQGRAEVRRLSPDTRLQAGTPGGYEAGIIKSEKQSGSDNALVGDKSREVPALEIILYNDNGRVGRARQVIQLAGVRADSHYGIQVFDEGTSCEIAGDCPPAAIVEPEPVPGPTITIPGEQVIIEKPGGLRTITRPSVVRLAIPRGYRLLTANPREAGAMATTWLLLAAPFAIAIRRTRLRRLG